MDRTEQTVVALLTAPSLEEASQQLGITSRTLRTWLHDDAALREAYYEAKRALMAHALSRMQRITAKAVTTLERVMDSPRAPAATKVAAAKAVIEIALKAVTLEDLESRLSRIEGELQKRKGIREVKQFAHRMKQIEAEMVTEDEDEGSTFDPDPAHYRLMLCREGNDEPQISPAYQLEPEEAALARVGLTPADIPAGLCLRLMPCRRAHNDGKHMVPWLWCDRPGRPATRKEMVDLEKVLREAHARTPEERARLEQERWERDRETLRRLRTQPPSAAAASSA